MSEAVNDPTGIDIPTGRLYLADRQIKECKEEIANLESTLANPASQLQDRSLVTKQLHRVKNDLETQSAPETTPEQRTALAKEEGELREKIAAAMPSQEEMRKCPPGAIGKHIRFEKEFKADMVRWKNIVRALNPGNDDPDVSNMEKFRPTTSTLNMENALIQGQKFFIPPATQEYRDGHDRTFSGGTETEKKIAEMERRLEELQARLSAPVGVQKPEVVPTFECKCGKMAKSLAGKKAHERNCDPCKAIN